MSTQPLEEIARIAVGVDPSESMLMHAERRLGTRYCTGSAEDLPFLPESFDLITVCSAFHWFDAQRFLSEAARAAHDDAWLIVYDNFISGMEEEPDFRDWFSGWYFATFPSPQRNRRPVEDHIEKGAAFRLVRSDRYENFVRFSQQDFVGYLLTQTNVIARVEGNGMPIESARSILMAEMDRFFRGRREGTFRFQGPIVVLRRNR